VRSKAVVLIFSIFVVFMVYWNDVEKPFDITVSKFPDIAVGKEGVRCYNHRRGSGIYSLFIPIDKVYKIIVLQDSEPQHKKEELR